jgi:hypothetical protein
MDSPELQVAVIGALTWAIMRGLKALGVIPQQGADWPKRVTAAVTAATIGLVSSWVAFQVSGTPVDWGELVAAVALAWLGATGLHTLTRKPKSEG